MVWAVFTKISRTPVWRQPLSFPLVPLNCFQKTGPEGTERETGNTRAASEPMCQAPVGMPVAERCVEEVSDLCGKRPDHAGGREAAGKSQSAAHVRASVSVRATQFSRARPDFPAGHQLPVGRTPHLTQSSWRAYPEARATRRVASVGVRLGCALAS